MSGTLSICVPTHHGRAGTLAELLASIAEQPAPAGRPVQVCVSDNASRDGTEDVVRRFERETGLPVTYRRQDREVPPGANMLASVELAEGDWVWPVGSDDRLAADALGTMAALLDAHPDAAGVTQPRASFSPDLRERLEPDRPEFQPTEGRTTVYRGAERVIATFGQAWIQMGLHVLHRETWRAAVAEERDRALAHPFTYLIHLLAAMARRRPVWVWYPTPLLIARADSSFSTTGDHERPLAELHANCVVDLASVWRGMAPPGSPVYRALMRRARGVLASGDAVRHIKSRPDHGLRLDLRMAATFARHFSRQRRFWLDTVPALVQPGPLQRARARRRERRQGPMPPLDPDACRTEVTMAAPARTPARWMVRGGCRVRNAGRTALVSSGPHPVHVSYRWVDANGEVVLDGLRTVLHRPLPPDRAIDCELRILTPWDPGEYRLRIAPVQELVAWFDDWSPRNGLDVGVRVEKAAPV